MWGPGTWPGMWWSADLSQGVGAGAKQWWRARSARPGGLSGGGDDGAGGCRYTRLAAAGVGHVGGGGDRPGGGGALGAALRPGAVRGVQGVHEVGELGAGVGAGRRGAGAEGAAALDRGGGDSDGGSGRHCGWGWGSWGSRLCMRGLICRCGTQVREWVRGRCSVGHGAWGRRCAIELGRGGGDGDACNGPGTYMYECVRP
jgi:hypothetical protein